MAVIQGGADVVHCSTQKAAGKLERRGQTGSACRTDRRTIRTIEAEARNQGSSTEIGKTSTSLGVDEGLVILRRDASEVFLCCRIDGARL